MSGLLHLGLVVFSFVNWSRLDRVVPPHQHSSTAALHASTGFAVLAAMIVAVLSAYHQQPWYKMKSFEEIAEAEGVAAAKGIKLTRDEAQDAARKKLLTIQSRAKFGLYGAVSTSLLLTVASMVVGRFARTRTMKVFTFASLGVFAFTLAIYFYLQQPWGNRRKSIEAEEIVRARWVNDPPPPSDVLQKAVASREFKEKRGTIAFPVPPS